MIVFKIDDAQWTLDLREGTEGALYEVRQGVTARQLHARPSAARWARMWLKRSMQSAQLACLQSARC